MKIMIAGWYLVAAALLSVAGLSQAQTPSLYPFAVDQDSLKGAPDFSFLNHALTPADRVFVRDGHFYTVSEYNQPWPNTHGAEIDPSLAVFASFQDWDAIMHFDYSGDRNWDAPIPNAFDVNGDWTKFPMIGQSAWIFRTYAARPGTNRLTRES